MNRPPSRPRGGRSHRRRHLLRKWRPAAKPGPTCAPAAAAASRCYSCRACWAKPTTPPILAPLEDEISFLAPTVPPVAAVAEMVAGFVAILDRADPEGGAGRRLVRRALLAQAFSTAGRIEVAPPALRRHGSRPPPRPAQPAQRLDAWRCCPYSWVRAFFQLRFNFQLRGLAGLSAEQENRAPGPARPLRRQGRRPGTDDCLVAARPAIEINAGDPVDAAPLGGWPGKIVILGPIDASALAAGQGILAKVFPSAEWIQIHGAGILGSLLQPEKYRAAVKAAEARRATIPIPWGAPSARPDLAIRRSTIFCRPKGNCPSCVDSSSGEPIFVVHAFPGKQGKRATLRSLARSLTAEGATWPCSPVAKWGQVSPATSKPAWRALLRSLERQGRLLPAGVPPPTIEEFAEIEPKSRLNAVLTAWSKRSPLPVVLFLDEIDVLHGGGAFSRYCVSCAKGTPTGLTIFPRLLG